MFSLAKLVLPVDFSDRSTGAARYARALARRFGSEITLLHVLPPPHYEFSALEVGGAMLNEMFAARSVQVREELERFLADELGQVEVRRVLLEGDPARKIIEHAHNRAADVILMPTHGYGPFRRFVLGSVTAKILHDADCPVWTGVHLEQAPPVDAIDFDHIMVALDLGPQSEKTLLWGAGLAQGYGASLRVIHVVQPCVPRGGEQPAGEWQKQIEERARAEVAALLARCGAEGEILIRCGDAPKVVCETAQSSHTELLVIGRGSAAGVFGRLRTNAYAIIRQSPCPVVSV